MKVEIWSDVMCPFCYIGKRKFEKALEQFPRKDLVEIEWKSFQLNPHLKTDPDKNIHQYLAEVKGWPLEYARKMNDHVTSLAKEVGLTYNFDKAIVANSFDAHRFSHLAKKHGLQDDAEERLFAAYFTEGKNTADHQTLIELGAEIGLDTAEIKSMLQSDLFGDKVQDDIDQAEMLGVRGVPFFVFNRRHAVTGAQPAETFLEALKISFADWEKENPLISVPGKESNTRSIDGSRE